MSVDYHDVRTWIEDVDKSGERKWLRGAHLGLEIGTISSRYERHVGSSALLFEDISGAQPGHHVPKNFGLEDFLVPRHQRDTFSQVVEAPQFSAKVIATWQDALPERAL